MAKNPATSLLRRFRHGFAACAAALLLAPAVAQAEANIVLLNSDPSVDKYRQMESIFRAQLPPAAARVTTVAADAGQPPEMLEKQLRDENPALIYSIGSKAYQLAAQFGGNRPILFSSVINWQRFNRAGNHYGIANELSPAQELSLLHYIFPELKRVGVLYAPQYSAARLAEAQTEAAGIGLTLVAQSVEAGDTAAALQALLPQIDVLWLIADPGVIAERATLENIFSASEAQRKPIYTYSDAFLSFGASLVAAADTPTMGRQAANLAQTLLRGEASANAVQTPAGSHITLNLCQLDKLRIAYNKDALDSVNRLLECGR